MDLKDLDWYTIITTTITTTFSTLIVGVVLAIGGYFIWKRQFRYQKKVEVYSKIITDIVQLNRDLIKAYNNQLSNAERKRIITNNNHLVALSEEFIFHFGESYRDTITDLNHLLQSYINYNNEIVIRPHIAKLMKLNKEDFENFVSDETVKIYASLKRYN